MRLRLWVIVLVGAVGLVACDSATPTPEPTPSSPATEPQPATTRRCDRPCRRPPRTVATFPVAEAPEASGLAAGRRNPDVFYILDDGPGTTSVLVVRARGSRMLGRLEIEGWTGVDPESLTVARCAPSEQATCLFIGDIGNNVRARAQVDVLRVPEPRITGAFDQLSVTADSVTLQYPRRPQNAEALLVHDDGTIGIVSKVPGRQGRGNGHLFVHDSFSDGQLTDVGRVALPPPAAPLTALFLGNVVTGSDSRPGRVLLRTYDAIYEFRGPADGKLEDFPTWRVTQVPAPTESQGEAVTYGPDGCSVFTVSEDSGRISGMRCR